MIELVKLKKIVLPFRNFKHERLKIEIYKTKKNTLIFDTVLIDENNENYFRTYNPTLKDVVTYFKDFVVSSHLEIKDECQDIENSIENINKVVTEIVYNFINCVEIEKTKKYLQ